LVWDQGFITPDHHQAGNLMSAVEALKASGFDVAQILGIVKGIQRFSDHETLPPHFSIVNNKYLSVPTDDGNLLLDINDINGQALPNPPRERKLMALTFWL